MSNMNNTLKLKQLRLGDFAQDFGKIASNRSISFMLLFYPVLFLLLFYLTYSFSYLFILLFVPLIFLHKIFHVYYRKTLPDWTIDEFVEGSMILSVGLIESHDIIKISIGNVEEIRIKNGYHKGYSPAGKYQSIGTGIYNGISSIIVILNDKSEYKFKYLIEDEFQFIKYRDIVERWYEMGIEIYETNYYSDVRTFLFEGYDGIELRKKLENIKKSR